MLKILLSCFLGAVIGYITNWLAIKMLFRPHKEVRIFGIKMPFTPGVIPKERYRIAKNIGDTVGKHLLTDKVIKEKLLNDDIKQEISNSVLELLSFEKIQVEQVAKLIYKTEYDNKISNMEDWLTIAINKEISKKDNQTIAIKYMENHIKNNYYNKPIESIVSNNTNEIIMSVVNDKFPILIEKAKSIKDNPIIEEKIKEAIDDFVINKLGALGAMFVKTDSIYSGICEKWDEKLDEEETRELLKDKIHRMISEIMLKQPNELLNEEQLDSVVNELLGQVINNISNIINENNIKQWVHIFVLQILKTEIIITEQMKNNVKDIVVNQWDSIVNNRMGKFIKSIDIPDMIEKEMNRLDIAEIENILLLIVKKELSAITWFGALLGFIMGLFFNIY